MNYDGIIKLVQENNIPDILVLGCVGNSVKSYRIIKLNFTRQEWAHQGNIALEYLFETEGVVYSHIDFDKKFLVLKQYGEMDVNENTFIPNYVIRESKDILKKCFQMS